MIKLLCPAPFISQAQWINGQVGICCNDDGMINDSLENEWNSKRRRNVRLQMLKGEIPDSCVNCLRIGNPKKKIGLNYWYKHLMGEKYYPTDISADGSIDEMPQYLHLSPSNKCNLACRMCNDVTSSTYATTYTNISHNNSLIRLADRDYLDYIKKIVPKLKYFVFHGGEPIYDEYFLDIIHFLSARKDEIGINILTNGTNLKCNNTNIVDVIKDFEDITITFSIDSIPLVNDYMRVYTDSEKVYKNFNRLCKEIPYAKMNIHSVHSNISMFSIAQWLTDLLTNKNFDRINNVSFYLINNPDIYAVSNMPVYLKTVIQNSLKSLDDKFKDDFELSTNETAIFNTLKNIRRELQTPYDEHLWEKFITVEKRKNQSVKFKKDFSTLLDFFGLN